MYKVVESGVLDSGLKSCRTGDAYKTGDDRAFEGQTLT
jgi:hypothetical protein